MSKTNSTTNSTTNDYVIVGANILKPNYVTTHYNILIEEVTFKTPDFGNTSKRNKYQLTKNDENNILIKIYNSDNKYEAYKGDNDITATYFLSEDYTEKSLNEEYGINQIEVEVNFKCLDGYVYYIRGVTGIEADGVETRYVLMPYDFNLYPTA